MNGLQPFERTIELLNRFWLLLGVKDTWHITIEHRLTKLLFLLFSSFFYPFVFYCFTLTVSSIPSKSQDFGFGFTTVWNWLSNLNGISNWLDFGFTKLNRKPLLSLSLLFGRCCCCCCCCRWWWCFVEWKQWWGKYQPEQQFLPSSALYFRANL